MVHPPELRLAELVASLSLATDLGLGQPEEHVLRQTVIATRLATVADLPDEQRGSVGYVSLLAWVGCISDSHELATWFGDDRAIRADSYLLDKTGLPMLRFMLDHLSGNTPARRITTIGRFLAGGLRTAMNSFVTHCETTGDIAERLGLPDPVRSALTQAFERWDGAGVPDGLRGAAIEPVMRVVQIADDAEVFWRTGGVDAALRMLTERSGTEFDPDLVELCHTHRDTVFGGLDEVSAWDVVLRDAGPDAVLDGEALRDALRTLGDYADLKSPWFLGHSRGLAALAAAAAGRSGLGADDVRLVEQAGWLCRLGVTGVSTGIWDKPGPLTLMERERVRTVPYLTERILCRHPRLAAAGAIAGLVHERMDGSGYPRGLTGAQLPATARVLAAAEVYQALAEDRPHRPALDPAARARTLTAEVTAGRLDADAVRAVLDVSGHAVGRRVRTVAGLTPREVEVLNLLVRGRSNRQIAEELSVTPRTVGSHVEHIYTKIGVRTRGAAAMYAMRHGLVDPSG